MRGSLRRVAEFGPQRLRLPILRLIPLLWLAICIGALVVIVRILVDPALQNIVAIVASVGLMLAFVLKDYASSLVAGVVMIIEGPYQPGDWIKMDGVYGEVKLIGVRATHIVTADDDEVIIPNSRLWSASITNATSSSHSLLCTADFYLRQDHDGEAERGRLALVGETNNPPLRRMMANLEVRAEVRARRRPPVKTGSEAGVPKNGLAAKRNQLLRCGSFAVAPG